MQNTVDAIHLLELCQNALQNHQFLDVKDIEDLVIHKKANICFKREDTRDTPALHALILMGNVRCVEMCLEIPEPIDFRVTENQFQRTPFHLACDEMLSKQQCKDMVRLLSERVQGHPEDFLNLWQKDAGGMNMLCLAASEQKLSAVWPAVKDLPAFSDTLESISLSPCTLWKWDWDALDEGDQSYFDITETVLVNGSEATGQLWRECGKSNPDGTHVEWCIAQGADPLIQFPSFNNGVKSMPLLYELLYSGDEKCCRACLNCQNTINFNFQANGGWSPFHCLCYAGRPADSTSKLLESLLDRLGSHPDERSEVKWSLQDDAGRDFLSSAAQMGLLTCVWNVLMERKVVFFLEPTNTFVLTCTMIHECDKELILHHPKKLFDYPNIPLNTL